MSELNMIKWAHWLCSHIQQFVGAISHVIDSNRIYITKKVRGLTKGGAMARGEGSILSRRIQQQNRIGKSGRGKCNQSAFYIKSNA